MNDLKERIHENGMDYVLCGDYYIPEFQISKAGRKQQVTADPKTKNRTGTLRRIML